jgi:hypothetical protein
MKLLNTKLILSAVGIALLATPAFAQQSSYYPSHRAGVHRQYRDPPGYSYSPYDSGSGGAYGNPPTAEW